MGLRDDALRTILKRKISAEEIADKNLNYVLEDENIRVLFVSCKRLVVEIAKLDLAKKDSSALRKEYNDNRLLIADLLKKNGIEKSILRPQYHCNKCKDTGIYLGKDCDCLKKEISKNLIKLSGVDIDNFAEFNDDFSIFKDSKKIKIIYDNMKKYIDNLDTVHSDIVLIVGSTGVGKTHLIECMTRYAISKSLIVKYSTAFNLNQDMLKYHCAKLEEKQNIIDPYLSSEILFIDDLGSENKINNVTEEYLYLVINERMQNHRKTVITTNLDFKQIQDTYGERIFSRLMHKKQSLKINFDGDDLRLKK